MATFAIVECGAVLDQLSLSEHASISALLGCLPGPVGD